MDRAEFTYVLVVRSVEDAIGLLGGEVFVTLGTTCSI